MSLIECPSCENGVSEEAASCPKCGHQFKSAGGLSMRDPVHVLGVALVVIFFAVVVIGAALMAGCDGRAIDAPATTAVVTDPACVWNFSTPSVAGETNSAATCFVPVIWSGRPALEADLRIPGKASTERIVFDLAAFRPLPVVGDVLDVSRAKAPLVHEVLPNDPRQQPSLDCYSGSWTGSIRVDSLPGSDSSDWQVEIDANCTDNTSNALHGVMSGKIHS